MKIMLNIKDLTVIADNKEILSNFNLSIKDGEKGQDKTLNLNLCDLEINNHKLYDSTFLSFAYESKNKIYINNGHSFTRTSISRC